LLAAAGIHHRHLDRSGAGTAEGALRGLCRAFAVSDLLLWDSPRALALIPALRDLPGRPRVCAHLAPIDAVPWDEAVHVAVRGRNAIDRHLVEDDATAAVLADFALGPQIETVAFGPVAPRPPDSDAPWAVVEGATWRRGPGAGLLLEALAAAGVPASALRIEALIEALLGGRAPARVAFPDPDLPSAAVVLALVEAGSRVHVAGGAVEERLVAARLCRTLDEVGA
ncbi:MAG: hypothetical protein RLN63_08585, partial [Miltoncostaeaceae bacterium]